MLKTLFVLTLFLTGFLPTQSLATSEAKKDKDLIHIGSIASLTGYGSLAGQAHLNGLILAVEEINKKGGIKGKLIQLHVEDNQSVPKLSVTAFHKLKAISNISALIGPNWTEFAEPVAHLANQSSLLMITPTGHSPSLLKDRPSVFSLQVPAREAIKPFSNYIINRKFREVVILHSQNSYYDMLTNALKNNLEEDLKVSSMSFPPDTREYLSTINKIKVKRDLGIVVLLLENGPASTFLKQARSQGLKPENLLFGPVYHNDEILKKDKVLTNGILFFDYSFSISKQFSEKYLERFNVHPIYDSTLAYDALNLMSHCLEIHGQNSKELISCIESSSLKGESGPLEFDENKNRLFKTPVTKVFQVKNGIPLEQ